MKKLSDKARMYARSYGQPPYGREIEGTAELLLQMAEKLDEYETLEEQGKLPKLPCAVGDTVYINCSVQGWYFKRKDRPYKAEVVFIGINGADGYINVDFGNGHMLRFKFLEIGKTVFLTKEEAEAALKELES